jgi:hypothetical protein
MTNRTVYFKGQAFGASPANIAVSLDGNVIFSGTVPAENNPPTPRPETFITLFTTELPVTFSGTMPMTVQVISGTVVFASVLADYALVPNPVFTGEQFLTVSNTSAPIADRMAIWTALATPPLTPEETATLEAGPESSRWPILQAHGISSYISGGPGEANLNSLFNGPYDDPRTNVVIDDIPQVTPEPRDEDGTWMWMVSAGSTMTCTLNVSAGKA